MSWDRTGMGMGAGMGCLPYYHKSRIIPRSGGIPPPHPCPTGMGMGREGQVVQPKQQENDEMP